MQTWEEILNAVQSALAGRSSAARAELERCWERTGPEDAAQRCIIAHYLADQQDQIAEEIAWDERALAAFADVYDNELAPIGVPSTAAFAPSLHLNMGDSYLRAGNRSAARSHLEHAKNEVHHLPADGYGAMIRGGLLRLEERIASTSHE